MGYMANATHTEICALGNTPPIASGYRDTDGWPSGVSAGRPPVMRNLLLLHNRGYERPNFWPVLMGGFIYIHPNFYQSASI